MNIGDVMQAMVREQVDDMVAAAGVMSLGELRAFLTACDPDNPIKISGLGYPGKIHSYRGYYRFPAIAPTGEEMTVADFLPEVEKAIGRTFEGWKGGEFTMSRLSPVWVSLEGQSSGLGLVDAVEQDMLVTLHVSPVEE